MLEKLPILALTLIVGLSGCNRARRSIAPDINAAEYDLFSGYLAYRFDGYQKNYLRLSFLNMTQSAEDDRTPFAEPPVSWQQTAEFLRQKAPVLQQTTIDSYHKANTQQAFIGHSLRSPIDYKLVDSAERNSYYERELCGDKVVTWSRVGFSADGTQALFYESDRGRLCGTGRYIVMEKENGNWTMKKDIMVRQMIYD